MEFMYRVEDKIKQLHSIVIYVYKFPLLKRTEKGFYINDSGYRRFILKSSNSKYAWLTIEEAMADFKDRKRKQIDKLYRDLFHAKQALDGTTCEYVYL